MTLGMVFDLDGVLFDSHPIHKKVWRELLQSLGRVVSDEELDFILDGAKRDEILHHFLGPLNREQVESYAKQKEFLLRNEEENLKTIDGLECFLELVESAGIPKVVATSASKPRAKRMLDRCQLTERFSAIVTGDDVSNGKSDPTIFLQCAEKLGAAPRHVLVFEDAVPAIKAAKSIGMKCVGLGKGARQSQLRKAGADLVVPDFMEFAWLSQPSLAALDHLIWPYLRC
jgi:HAD superfamily hydrolase (TIGR01509 family)